MYMTLLFHFPSRQQNVYQNIEIDQYVKEREISLRVSREIDYVFTISRVRHLFCHISCLILLYDFRASVRRLYLIYPRSSSDNILHVHGHRIRHNLHNKVWISFIELSNRT